MSQTITFQEVVLRGTKSIKCAGGCGRTLKRQRKFWQTLSPFNKNVAGEPKDRSEILQELLAERKTWIEAPEACSHCAKGQGAQR